ncbi:SpoIIE family protein phosphatase [Kineococcus gypseus]|uniref:SpoIIE family protein phosphatase n=1 Tax=Kineococcus gypseus TaxID=1637102 RepID=UPI003D7C8EA7
MIDRRREHQTLLEVTTLSLRHGQDLRAILHDATEAATEVTGAAYGAFFYHDRDEHGERLDLLTVAGAAADAFPADAPVRSTPLFAPTFEGRAPVRIDDVLADPRFGRGRTGGGAHGAGGGAHGAAGGGLPAGHVPVRSYLAVPVTSTDGRVLGALLLGHGEPGRFDEEAEAVAVAAARGAAIAVDNALLLGEQRAARRLAEEREAAAERAAARTALLQSITALLSTSATTADIAAAVPRAVTEVTGCTAAALYLTDPVHRVLAAHSHPPLPAHLAGLGVVPLHADDPVAEAVRTGRPVLFTVEQAQRYENLRGVDPGVVRSSVVVPMLDRSGRSLGALNVNWVDPEPHHDEVELFSSVAAQTALALERAQLLDAERAAREDLAASVGALTELARTLQRGLLPRRLPSLERVSVAVRYQPAVVGAEVGGDWYDAVALDDGVVFVIGDVQGHSTTAAGLMGQLRTAVRAYVSEGHGPAEALERTNRLLVDQAEELFATCCLVRLEQGSGAVTVATAGHPAPLVADERGLRELDVEPGPPLGVDPEAVFPASSHRLRGRSRVVLYTDGVVESRATQLDAGEEALRRSVSEGLAADPGMGCEELADRIATSIPHRLDDDAALLVLEYRGPAVQLEEAALPLTADARAVAQARWFLRTALTAWGAGDLLDEAELVLSELVTNAVVHTESAAAVQLRYDRAARRLTLSVQDRSTRHPRQRHAGADALGGRGLGIVEAVADDWGVSVEGDGKTVWAELAVEPGAGTEQREREASPWTVDVG